VAAELNTERRRRTNDENVLRVAIRATVSSPPARKYRSAAYYGIVPSTSLLDLVSKFMIYRSGSRKLCGLDDMILSDTLEEPATAHLVSIAFEKSWQFVRTDPVLACDEMDRIRDRLGWHLESLAQNGERDVWRLANGAIAELRREVWKA